MIRLFLLMLPVFLTTAVQSTSAADFHKNIWGSTDRCRLCHRALDGKSFAFRQTASLSELCLSCHGNGTGAYTDVQHGLFTGPGDAFGNGALQILNGGGFKSILQGSSNALVSSSHDLGVNVPILGTSINAKKMHLSCVSCHDAHANQNYRWQIASGNAKVASNEDKFATKSYKPSFTSPRYRNGQTQACLICHDAYGGQMPQAGQQAPAFDAGDGKGILPRYHHPVQIPLSSYTPSPLSSSLPLDQPQGFSISNKPEDEIQCLTCHRAHGTESVMRGFAAFVNPGKSSSLLRLDNRDVCQECHKL